VNFDLSDEQRMLQETVKQFLDNECPVTHLREIFDGDTGHDPALWKGMVEMGLTGLAISEQYGGAGLEILDLAATAETLGYCAAPGPFFGHSLAALAIERGGSEAQKEKWLPGLASGEFIGSVAFFEDGAKWQPDEWSLAAASNGDAHSLTGTKKYVPQGDLADLVVVGLAGGELAVVEARGAAASGVEVAAMDGADRTRRFHEVQFEGAACELLEGGAGASAFVRDVALVLLTADAFGGGSRLVDISLEYAKTREQFGVTIGHFQALKHQIANMALATEPGRGLYWYAVLVRRLCDGSCAGGVWAHGGDCEGACDGSLHGGGEGERRGARRVRVYLGVRRSDLVQAGDVRSSVSWGAGGSSGAIGGDGGVVRL